MLATYSTNKIIVLIRYVSERRRRKTTCPESLQVQHSNHHITTLAVEREWSDIQCLLQRYLEHWGTFFTQQHVVARISEIRRPHAPVTTAGVDNSESVVHLTFVHGHTIHPAFQPSDHTEPLNIDWPNVYGCPSDQLHSLQWCKKDIRLAGSTVSNSKPTRTLITVPTLLLTKNSRTFPGPPKRFSALCHSPAMLKHIDKQQLLTLYNFYTVWQNNPSRNIHHRLQRNCSVSNVAGILHMFICTRWLIWITSKFQDHHSSDVVYWRRRTEEEESKHKTQKDMDWWPAAMDIEKQV